MLYLITLAPRHSLTLPLALGTKTKLLHHSDVPCQHLLRQNFVASAATLAPPLAAFIEHKPLLLGEILGTPGMQMTAFFHMQFKCTFKGTCTQEKVTKFIVHSACDCLTCPFACFFFITGKKIIWNIGSSCVGTETIGYASFIYTCATCM